LLQSFDGISNNREAVEQATSSPTLGQTFLSNVFATNTSMPRSMSFLLSRTTDSNQTANADGALTIGEVEAGFEAITSQKQLPILTTSNDPQWIVQLDGITVNGKLIELPPSSAPTAPVGSLLALIDTGTTALLAPNAILTAIYGSISGAQKLTDSTGSDNWLLPCDAVPPATAFVFAGQSIPIHPLDLSRVIKTLVTADGQDVTLCSSGMSGFQGTGPDLIMGDVFMRNAYTMFNFGKDSTPTGASIQMLAITDPGSANADFTTTRKVQLANAPAATAQQIQQLVSGQGNFMTTVTPVFQTSVASANAPASTAGTAGTASAASAAGTAGAAGAASTHTGAASKFRVGTVLFFSVLLGFVTFTW
jgi:hypothetical protein